MKGTIKLLSVLMIAVMLVSMIPVQVFADDKTTTTGTYSGLITEIDDKGKGVDNSEGATAIKETVGKIIKLIRNVAVIAGVLILTVLGFKYMLGSAEEKADYKKSLVPLVVGIVVIMAAAQIMSMIFSFLG